MDKSIFQVKNNADAAENAKNLISPQARRAQMEFATKCTESAKVRR